MKEYRLAKWDTFKDLDQKSVSELEFRRKCKQALKQTENLEETLLARKWCMKKTNVNDVLAKRGLRLLNENSSPQDWQKLFNDVNPSNIGVEELKQLCKGVGNAQSTSDEFNDNLEFADSSCSISK